VVSLRNLLLGKRTHSDHLLVVCLRACWLRGVQLSSVRGEAGPPGTYSPPSPVLPLRRGRALRCMMDCQPCAPRAPRMPLPYVPARLHQVHLAPFRLRWLAPDGAELAADRESCAYGFGQRSGAVLHAMARAPGDAYFGLGDKTGGLDLHGRRLRTVMTDAMGYDPQCARRLQARRRCGAAMGRLRRWPDNACQPGLRWAACASYKSVVLDVLGCAGLAQAPRDVPACL